MPSPQSRVLLLLIDRRGRSTPTGVNQGGSTSNIFLRKGVSKRGMSKEDCRHVPIQSAATDAWRSRPQIYQFLPAIGKVCSRIT